MKYLIIIVVFLLSHEVVSQQSSDERHFLKVTGPDVSGTSQQAKHLNEIVLRGFNFSILNNVNIGSVNGTAAAGRASSGPINFEFKASKGASKFFEHLHNGNGFDEFKISAMRQFSSGLDDYVIYTFKAVVVSNFTSEYSMSADEVIYNIAVKVGTMKMEYFPTLDGGSRGSGIDMQWSFIKNEANEGIN